MIGLALAIQAATATVGDTVWLAVAARVPNGHVLRPQTWDLGEVGSVLAAPEVDYQAGLAVIRYPVAFWFPGQHRVTVPGAIIVSNAGQSDTLPATEQVVVVATVLPDSLPKTALDPRPPAAVVEQASRSWLPVGVLVGIAGLGIFASWIISRRPPPAGPSPVAPVATPDPEAVLATWRSAGEGRTALDGWAKLVAADAERRGPAEREAGLALVAELTEASFRVNADASRLDALVDAAKRWRGGAA